MSPAAYEESAPCLHQHCSMTLPLLHRVRCTLAPMATHIVDVASLKREAREAGALMPPAPQRNAAAAEPGATPVRPEHEKPESRCPQRSSTKGAAVAPSALHAHR
eukprot:2843350-Prymnesium_polylepis.1